MKTHFLPKFIVLVFFCVCASLLISPVYSQSISTGKVVGKVFLNSGELVPGVQVEISGPALLQGRRSVVSSENGSFFFLDLPLGKYRIAASMEGFKTASYRDIGVTPGGTVTLNVILEPGAISESVEVLGKVTTVDVKTSTVDSKITKEMLAKLPTSRDSFYDLSLSTPGMFDTGKEAMGSPTAYGGATTENIFLVNGVDTTDPSGSGYGSMINVNYNTVEEVRVISLGSKAEYGNFSGVAIDVITKSGSNTLQGSLGFYSQIGSPKTTAPAANALGRDWIFIAPGTDFSAYVKKDMELDLTIGGPFISKKLWFFAAGNLLTNQAKQLNWDPLAKWTGRYGDIKITGTPLKNHHAWVAYHFEKNNSSGTTDGSLNWDESMAYNSNDKAQSISAQWQWFPKTTTYFTLKFLGFKVDSRSSLPDGHMNRAGLINWYQAVPTDSGVGGAFEGFNGNMTTRSTIQADVSHYAENFLGEHDIKFGVQYTRGRKKGTTGNFFSKQLTDPDGQDLGLMGYYQNAYMYGWNYNIQYMQEYYAYKGFDQGLVMYINRSYEKPKLTVRTSDSIGFFFDDQWSLGKRLTLNLGLRYDNMTAKFAPGQMLAQPATPEDFSGALQVTRDRSGTDNLFDFKCLSPRLGVTYQLTNDQKTVLRTSFGRYYTPIGVESFGAAGPDLDRTYSEQLFYLIPWEGLDQNGDGIIFGPEMTRIMRMLYDLTPINGYLGDFDYTNRFVVHEPAPYELKIHAGLKNQFTDQFTVSLEREIFRDVSLAATYIHRTTKNMIVQWPLNKQTQQPWEYERKTQTINGQDVSLYSIVLKDYDGNGVIDGDDIRWIGENGDFEWRNMGDMDGKKAQRLFQGLQLTVTKRYADRWQLMGSLLFNHSSGFAARNKRQDQDYNMEGTNIWSDTWLAGINQTVNNMEGPLPFTPRFEFKVSGNYTIPKIEVDLGVRFRFHNGRPVWQTEEIPQILRQGSDLTDAELMAHAVITTGGNAIVAMDPTKPLYLPAQKILDLHLEKTIELGPGNLHLILDGFNVFNSKDVTNANTKIFDESVAFQGQLTGILSPRTFRFGIMYEF
jgi:outer membrane receptor protein involved in Fe transport